MIKNKNSRLRLIAPLTALVGAMILPTQSQALIFELNDIGGAGVGSNARAGFDAAANIWSSLLQDDFTVRLDIGFSALGAGILGSTSSAFQVLSYTDTRTALNNDATSTSDAQAVANLQTGPSLAVVTNPSSPGKVDTTKLVLDNDGSANNRFLAITRANAKAIGFADTGASDANITFSSSFNFDFNQNDGIASDSFDFIGVAIHEIGHVLGFSSGVDIYDVFGSPNGPSAGNLGKNDLNNFAVANILDLFRYQEGNLDWSVGGNPLFSIDGGITDIAPFSSGRFNGDGQQASHWQDNLGLGILDPTFGFGEFGQITPLDILAFDVIGYDLRQAAIPEPHVFGLALLGLLAMGSTTRKRQTQRN